MKMIWSEWKNKEKWNVLVNQFHRNFCSKTLSCGKIKSVFRDLKWCCNASWGLKGLNMFGELIRVCVDRRLHDKAVRTTFCHLVRKYSPWPQSDWPSDLYPRVTGARPSQEPVGSWLANHLQMGHSSRGVEPGYVTCAAREIMCQQTRDSEPMMGQRWARVVDGGPTLAENWVIVSCLLGHWSSRDGCWQLLSGWISVPVLFF